MNLEPDVRFLYLAIYSPHAKLGCVAGMQGIVKSLYDFMYSDKSMLRVIATLRTTTDLSTQRPLLTELLNRFRFRRPSHLEYHAMEFVIGNMLDMIDSIKNYDFQFYSDLASRLYSVLEIRDLSSDWLCQEVCRIHAMVNGAGRFALKEVRFLNFEALKKEGIVIRRIHNDVKGLDATLVAEGSEVSVTLRINDDYPYRSPFVTFNGDARPLRFRLKQTIDIQTVYDYAFSAVEDSLRAILVDMHSTGVTLKKNVDV